MCNAATGDILSCDPATGDCAVGIDASSLMSGGMPVANMGRCLTIYSCLLWSDHDRQLNRYISGRQTDRQTIFQTAADSSYVIEYFLVSLSHLPVCLSVCLPVCQYVCLFIHLLSVCLPVYLSVCLPVCVWSVHM